MPRSKPGLKRKFDSEGGHSRSPVPKRTSKQKSQVDSKRRDRNHSQERAPEATLFSLLDEALAKQTFVKLVLSNPISKSNPDVTKVTVREVNVKGQTKLQWAGRNQSQEFHENLSIDEFKQKTQSSFGVVFGDAHLFTTEADLTVRWRPGQPHRIKRKLPSQSEKLVIEHNQAKQYLIPADIPCAFLAEIGIMLPNGQVRPSMYHKFRQINRYLEFVEDLIPQLPSNETLHIVDFGCGKSYLTFALHHLLTKIHQRDVSITGLDVKESVIEDCSRIAHKLGCDGLRFQIGRIENFTPEAHVHLAVSLHACDTATDEALAAALSWQCDAILAVPCCQHEICDKLSQQVLPGLVRYGILKDRFASLITDDLRAQLLELNGYRTQVLEFIETEHTPKNLLIRAVRRKDGAFPEMASRREEYDQLKKLLGLTDWHLESALQQAGIDQ